MDSCRSQTLAVEIYHNILNGFGFHLHLGLPSKMTKPSLVHPPNLDTLMAANEEQEEIIVPPEVTQDRVFFIFNNLSQMNMQQKVGCSCSWFICMLIRLNPLKLTISKIQWLKQ